MFLDGARPSRPFRQAVVEASTTVRYDDVHLGLSMQSDKNVDAAMIDKCKEPFSLK